MNDTHRNSGARNHADGEEERRVEYLKLGLLDACCNDTLDVAQTEQLNRLLSTDVRFRELYTDYMLLHASLYFESTALGESVHKEARFSNKTLVSFDTTGMEDAIEASDACEVPLLTPSTVSIPPDGSEQRWAFSRERRLGVGGTSVGPQRLSTPKFRAFQKHLLLAGVLVGIGLVSSWLTYTLTRSGTSVRSGFVPQRIANGDVAITTNPTNGVAQITATYNCLWEPTEGSASTMKVGYGTLLTTGQQLHLREGLVEITFYDGATVLLEGPAAFVVNASDHFNLQSGRLAAVVPEHARGFRIHTQVLDVFDVGTEFGLMANASGTTELHVFGGLVKADVLNANGGTRRRLELGSTEAARVNQVSTVVEEFPADQAKFIRHMIPSSGPHDGLLAHESFDYPAGPLAAQNGGFGWAGPWFNIAVDEKSGPDSNCVSTGSLTTTGMIPTGNRAFQAAQGNRIRRALACSVGGVFDAAGLVENQDGVRLVGRDGNTVYLSFAQRVTATGDGFYGVELHRGDGNANRVLSIGSGAEGTGYGVTSNVNAYGLTNYPTLGEESTEVNFFVVKISFGVDNRDTVEIFRNPVSLRDEQACSIDAVLKGNFAFDRISLGNFGGDKLHEVDEIRVGTHFLAVTGRWGGNRGRLLRQLTQCLPGEQVVRFARLANSSDCRNF